MKRKKYKVLIICLLMIIYFFAVSCNVFRYDGNYPELYSIAINSILGANGYF
jgi:hypothetical protein